jgi:aminopeptidase
VAPVDARVAEYARLLVERCLGVQPGWQVLIRSTPSARPALEELMGLIADAGAYPLLRMNFSLWPLDEAWSAEAPAELVAELAPIDRYAADHMDARVTMDAPDNTRGTAALTPERRALAKKGIAPFFRRTIAHEIPWVSCQFPTNALAQEAGMPLAEFEDFFYRACLRDWDEESKAMHRLLERFDAADEVRIVGEDTDLSLSLRGRTGEVDDGHVNMPGGEFFFSPVEDSRSTSTSRPISTEPPSTVSGSPSATDGSRKPTRSRARTCSSRPWTWTRARAASVSSGSAAMRGSRSRCGTSSSTRRWRGPCT